ncbi:Uncharacterised protein [Enterobacter kobei]|nr:Uncharacterised protein [Enterobacter kobei]SAG50216.1 Uncharacterised protein [Enterobacter kobei]
MFFCQQLLIRRIAIKYDRILQLLRQFRSPLLIALDQFHAIVFFQPARETRADIAAADQHNTFIRLFETL